jgi:hypothetical protein
MAMRTQRSSPVRRMAGAMLVAAFLLPHASMAEVIDRVVAVVAGDLIMLSDVIVARELRLIRPASGVAPLIDRALILSEVTRYAPPEPSPDAVTSALERVRSSFPTPEALAQVLQRGGIDEAQLRERLRQDLRIAAYLDQRFTVPAPTDAEIAAFRAEHSDRFRRNGVDVPLDDVRTEIVDELTSDRRKELVEEWLDGLRRRVPILDLSDGVP